MRCKVTKWKTHKTYRLIWTDDDGKTHRKDTGCRTRIEAEAYMAAWLRGVIPGNSADSVSSTGQREGNVALIDQIAVDDLCEAYLTRHKKVQMGGSAKGATSQRVNLEVIRQKVGKSLLADMTSNDMEKLRDELLSEGRANGTVRRYFSALIAAVNWGLGAGLVSPMVRAGLLGGFTLPPASEPDAYWLTKSQRDHLWRLSFTLLQNRDTHWRAAAAICLALSTAARRDAILGLTWSRVLRGDEQIVDFRDKSRVSSNKKRVALPISEEAGLVFDELWKITEGSLYVLGRPGTIKRGFMRIREVAGLPTLKFKTLRATWASLAAQRGVDLSLIAEVLGDDIETTRRHYAHLSPTHLRAAF